MSLKICRRTGKVGYRSVGEARAAAEQIWRRNAVKRVYHKRETGAYPCEYCPRWHLTSQIQSGPAGVNFADPA